MPNHFNGIIKNFGTNKLQIEDNCNVNTNSCVDPGAIFRNCAKSLSVFLPQPSTMFNGIE